MSGFERIGVVGCGLMGSGFAEVCARAGLGVTVVVRGEDAVDRGRGRLVKSLERARRKGRISETERDDALERVSFSTALKDLRDHDFVLESVSERLQDKLEVFAELDEIVEDRDAVLASNTSSIPIMKLGRATRDPGRVAGAHFFNPVPMMPLVELIGSLRTRPETLDRVGDFVTGPLGKEVVRGQDQPGFVVNALLVPYLLSAVRMLESGAATAEAIDRSMILGCGHPMGPLALIDLIGLDTIASIGESMHEELKEPLYSPPPLLLRMIEGGFLGKKSGEGFHSYA
ncbi:3-hydroxybutyryl-CoA dehydrogenase [Streptomyces sp. NPDC096310]|uniref:3-hydroxybutyryl-CoA dehydrogenase n=1 Tax=Streptomyces sp. NPDC096310 TaxID=3366082 RepID=UPI0037FEE73E